MTNVFAFTLGCAVMWAVGFPQHGGMAVAQAVAITTSIILYVRAVKAE